MEMIKGIKGHGYYDELVVPIIENTAYEYELTEALAKAIEAYTKTTAVLVRNHGIYVWGDSWISAKTLAECYHYLFDATIKLHQLGLDWSTPNHGPIQSIRSLMIAGESNASDKTRKANGEIDPFPLTSNANGQFLRHFEIHGVVFPCNFNFNSRSLSPFVLQCCIVLDIEGNTTPISFVTEVLFPYACQNVGRHLSMTYDTPETESDIKLLCSQVRF
ncbi:putative bifunctional methylthioribulose-1-phosphate dehydratase/enolase-phosphatase E1 [Glycine soja]